MYTCTHICTYVSTYIHKLFKATTLYLSILHWHPLSAGSYVSRGQHGNTAAVCSHYPNTGSHQTKLCHCPHQSTHGEEQKWLSFALTFCRLHQHPLYSSSHHTLFPTPYDCSSPPDGPRKNWFHSQVALEGTVLVQERICNATAYKRLL